MRRHAVPLTPRKSSAALLDKADDRRAELVAGYLEGAEKITLTLRVTARTNRACCVCRDHGQPEVWLPNSLLENVPVCVGGWHDITLPERLANQKGLI